MKTCVTSKQFWRDWCTFLILALRLMVLYIDSANSLFSSSVRCSLSAYNWLGFRGPFCKVQSIWLMKLAPFNLPFTIQFTYLFNLYRFDWPTIITREEIAVKIVIGWYLHFKVSATSTKLSTISSTELFCFIDKGMAVNYHTVMKYF